MERHCAGKRTAGVRWSQGTAEDSSVCLAAVAEGLDIITLQMARWLLIKQTGPVTLCLLIAEKSN
jgi:hypothetical protein